MKALLHLLGDYPSQNHFQLPLSSASETKTKDKVILFKVLSILIEVLIMVNSTHFLDSMKNKLPFYSTFKKIFNALLPYCQEMYNYMYKIVYMNYQWFLNGWKS